MRILTCFKEFGALASALLLGAAFLAAPVSAAPKIGAPAPDFAAVDSKGNPVKLSDYKGKTVILEWTNHGCPYVQKHYGTGNMQSLQEKTTADGIVWLTVISSAPGLQGYVEGSEADEMNAERGAKPTAVLLDPEGKIGKLYEAKVTPHMYIINSKGVLAYMGAIDDKPTTKDDDVKAAHNYVLQALEQISKGKDVDPSITRAYGCSVKYSS